MDYKGQRLGEYIYSILTILFGSIAWIIGYVQGDFMITFYGWSIGLILSLLLCIPDWPMFNRNQIVWLNEIGKENKPQILAKASNSSSKTKQKKSKIANKEN